MKGKEHTENRAEEKAAFQQYLDEHPKDQRPLNWSAWMLAQWKIREE